MRTPHPGGVSPDFLTPHGFRPVIPATRPTSIPGEPYFACAEDRVHPDILALGKGLAAGYQPLSAMLVSPAVQEAISAGSGLVKNGQTFVNHTLACATALEVQKIIIADGLLDNVRRRGAQLRSRLGAALATHPHIGDVRGRGLFVGVELVAEKETKTPFPSADDISARLRRAALREGMMIYPMAGTIDGTRGDHVLFAPPFTSTEDDIERIVATFAAAVDSVFAGREETRR